MTERDATTMWRTLFNGQSITEASLDKAEAILDSMNPESPLRMRLATELQELRKLAKRSGRRKTPERWCAGGD